MGIELTSRETVEIRRLTPADIDVLIDVETANQPVPWTKGVFRDELNADNRVYLAVIRETSLLGFGGVMVVGEEAHITNLLVSPDQRRKGYARRLVIGLIDHALEMGAKHLTLEVRSRNQPAQDLYRRFGLAPVGMRPGYYGDDDAVIMWAHDIDSGEFAAMLEELR